MSDELPNVMRSDDVARLALLGGIIGLVSMIFGYYEGRRDMDLTWKRNAIERGLAQYCPITAKWAWKGECDADDLAFDRFGTEERFPVSDLCTAICER